VVVEAIHRPGHEPVWREVEDGARHLSNEVNELIDPDNLSLLALWGVNG
jgi:hypothetical protein